MEDLFVFMASFIIIFIIYLIIYIFKRRKKELNKMKEFDILASRFNLKRKNMNTTRLGLIFVLVNSLIISLVGTFVTMIDVPLVWQLLMGFAGLMALIIIFYSLIGFILKKKEGKNNEYKRNWKKVAR